MLVELTRLKANEMSGKSDRLLKSANSNRMPTGLTIDVLEDRRVCEALLAMQNWRDDQPQSLRLVESSVLSSCYFVEPAAGIEPATF
jgi:hypothetical protein